MNWRDISYLRSGTVRQQKVYRALCESHILSRLAAYDPLLVSTICIGVDTENSDLDLVCEVHDFAVFEDKLRGLYGHYPDFEARRRKRRLVVRFRVYGFIIEISAEARPVETQNAFRHMVVCDRLLNFYGDALRRSVRKLKRAGMKTEPAFTTLLGLPGDAFQTLLHLYDLTDEQLRHFLQDKCLCAETLGIGTRMPGPC